MKAGKIIKIFQKVGYWEADNRVESGLSVGAGLASWSQAN